jgi:hypothetical protein
LIPPEEIRKTPKSVFNVIGSLKRIINRIVAIKGYDADIATERLIVRA